LSGTGKGQGVCALAEVRACSGFRLIGTTRHADVVARYGGEEFVIILPEISKQGGDVVAEKIRAAVEQYPFYGCSKQPGGRVTVTLGLATFPEGSGEGLELVDVADRAMYIGKQHGGNRVSVAPDRIATPSPAS